ncbi:hypothetical protein [Flavobacterium humi]|uniref:Uncharacterized protein n=1 Tax=Flavobacterium humi TaxID=2562683 RepID=A0A4Z0LA60_9FLAO|nr:hypothetical protein [Flavobacterium humi]TGD58741.1 hypothetical protein E4635_07445 [Flavobacterium humi]
MKLNRKIKGFIGGFFALTAILFIILIVHIATATKVVYDNATIQISRIDFTPPVDPLEAKDIHRNLKSIPGVQHDKLNTETGILVYFHDNRITNAQKVYDQLMTKGHYKAKPYIISQEMASKSVCPIMDTESYSYKFSKFIQNIFH